MAWAISIPQNPTLQEPDKQPGLGAYIAIEPERWVGKRLPLLRHIDIADQLERGQWLVVLYASSDPQCQAMMPKYRQMAEELIDRGAIPRMALVEMPPYEQSRQNTIAAERFCLRGRLRDDQWFAPIPVEFKLVDGVVVASQAKGTGFTWLKRTVR